MEALTSRSGFVAERYDRISWAYDLIADPAEQTARDRGLALLHAEAGERVLEIGTGTGRALEEIADSVAPGGLACGLDLSMGMLTLARQNTETAGDCVDSCAATLDAFHSATRPSTQSSAHSPWNCSKPPTACASCPKRSACSGPWDASYLSH